MPTPFIRILFLQDPTVDENQEDQLDPKIFKVRTVQRRQDIANALEGFAPQVLLCHLNADITVKEVLEQLKIPEGNTPIILSVVGKELQHLVPVLKAIQEPVSQKEIHELEEQYKSVYHTSLDGILITEPNGKILAANPAACQMLEMTEEEICLAGRSGLIDPENPNLASAVAQREIHGKVHTELNFLKRNGEKVLVELSSSVYKDSHGALKTTIIIRDITQRKKAEEELNSSHETYKTLFYNSPIPYLIYDRETLNMIDVNEVALEIYGYTREEFLELNLLDLRPQEDIPLLLNHLKKSDTDKEIVRHGKVTHLKKDGSSLRVEIFGYKLKYGNRNCGLTACVDFTEKEKALEELKQKQKRLAAAQEIAKLGYWQFDLINGTFIFSDMMYQIWGIDKNRFEPSWETITATIHPDDQVKFRRAQESSMMRGKEHDLEYRIVQPSGKIKWIHERGRVLSWKEEMVASIEGIVQDITEEKVFLEKLMTSESRYKGIVQSQTNYLIRTDMEGNYTYYNDKFLKDFGWLYAGNEIVGQPSLSSIMPYHHQAVIDLVEQCVAIPGKAFQMEIDKPNRTGGVRTTLWDFICLIDAEGLPKEIQCVGTDISARVKAEIQLKDSKLRYQLITEATSDAIWDWDVISGNLFWGKSFKSMFGYDPKNFPTIKEWEKLVHPDDFARVSLELKTTIEGVGSRWFCEYRLKKNDGDYAFVVEKGTVLRDEKGRALRLVGALQDITENRKLQNLLEKANSLSRIGSFELDLEGESLYWSPMTREIHEVDVDYIPCIAKGIEFYKEGESRRKIKEALRLAAEKNCDFDEELQIITTGGKELWVRVIGEPELENGKCIKINGSFQDINKTKTAELGVLQAAKEKETLLESVGDAFFAVDEEWTITYWNEQAATLLNSPKKDVLNKNLWNIFSDAVGTTFHKNYLASMKDGKIRHFESFFNRTSSWYEVTAYPSQNGLSVFFRDVTERKLADVKLRELNKSLKAHTRELVTANKGLEQFSYIVSHNLRSPVANILGLADLLKDNTYPSEVKEQFLSEIFSNIERLDAVITDLNSILQTKVDIKAKKEKIDLNKLVEGIKASIQKLITEEEVDIFCNFKAISTISTVRSYLYSIFYNLIINSIKYRRQEVKPVMQLKTDIKGDFVVITFQDNGLGIDLTAKGDQVFNLYKRFHHHVQGKGMGLFMVKTQVEMLGGKINLESKVNEGTTFTIVLKKNNMPIEIKDETAISIHGNR